MNKDELNKGRLRLISKFFLIVILIAATVALYQYLPSLFSPTIEVEKSEAFADGLIYYKHGIDLSVSRVALHTTKVLRVKKPVIYAIESSVCYEAESDAKLYRPSGEEIESKPSDGKLCWSIEEEEVVLKHTKPLAVEDLASSYVSGDEVKIKIMNVKIYPIILDLIVDLEDKFGDEQFSVYKNQLLLTTDRRSFSDNFIVAPYSQVEYSFKV